MLKSGAVTAVAFLLLSRAPGYITMPFVGFIVGTLLWRVDQLESKEPIPGTSEPTT
jgi:hypothetical protein